jgi:predicted nucleic acid-binding protein
MIVVDTNVASELMRPSPERAVQEWVRSHEGRELCTTAITVAEILYGIERLPGGRRKEVLWSAAAEIFEACGGPGGLASGQVGALTPRPGRRAA